MMLLRIASAIGPSVTPSASAAMIAGKRIAFERRKKVAASRSRTNSQPSGEVASQLSAARSFIASWKRSPRSASSV